jgi:hypothetical protein
MRPVLSDAVGCAFTRESTEEVFRTHALEAVDGSTPVAVTAVDVTAPEFGTAAVAAARERDATERSTSGGECQRCHQDPDPACLRFQTRRSLRFIS